MKLYTYKGSISSTSYRPKPMDTLMVVMQDYADEYKAPALFEAAGDIKEYIEKLIGEDSEERYAEKIVYFTTWCLILKIELLDDNGKVFKTVTSSLLEQLQ